VKEKQDAPGLRVGGERVEEQPAGSVRNLSDERDVREKVFGNVADRQTSFDPPFSAG
jgi:hypothetical protein